MYGNIATLNRETPDLRDLQGNTNLDKKATYCSSMKCCAKSSSNSKGRLVALGNKFTHRCPHCRHTVLFHERVSTVMAAKLERKL